MDLEKLERLAKLVLTDLKDSSSLEYSPDNEAKFKNLMSVAHKTLPEHQELFLAAYANAHELASSDASSIIEHLLKIIELEKASETNIEQLKIFESAEDKLKQAGLSFRKDDCPSVFHNLNTSLELVLKDKVGIPSTITGVNTSNIIDVLTKYKVEPHLYLEQARKHILEIDNKIKHQGYVPTKLDCINGIKAMEELIARLRNVNMNLTEEIKNKIYEGL